MDELFERVRRRVDVAVADDDLLADCVDTISSRLCLRLGVDSLPSIFNTICIDAVVKMARRFYYEGITTEGVANISTSFVEDILNEYNEEIQSWKNSANNIGETGRSLRFL